MDINITPREMPSTIKEGHFLVEVNGTPIGFIEPQRQGTKTIYQGFVGETRVFTNVRSQTAALDEMVKQIKVIHMARVRKTHRAFGIAKPAPIITEITSK